MAPGEDRLREELAALVRRLDRVERHLGLSPAHAPPRPSEVREPTADEAPQTPPPPAPVLPPLVGPAPIAPPALGQTSRPGRAAPRNVSRVPEDEKWRIERLVAGRWYAIAGALIVTVGVALLFKLALDRGWLSFSPTARCLAGAAFGLAMLGIGEWLRRRTLGPRPSFQGYAPVGLNAAGVGSVYAAAFAAYGLYGLVGAPGGFLLLALAAALGIVIGARARQAAVTIVSLVAGYAAPFLVEATDPHPLVMPAYLLALLIVGETLCAWRSGRFAAVRLVAWAGTVGAGTLWALQQGVSHLPIACVFIAIVWLIVHTELVWTARRRGFPPVNWYASDLREDWAGIRPYAVSLSTAVWSCVLATVLVRRWGGTEEWIPSAAAAVVCGGLGAVLARGLRALMSPPRDDAGRLGTLLVTQAGAATIGAVALGLAGWTEVVAWLAMGVAAVAAGSRIGSRGLHVYGVIVLAIAAGRLMLYDAWEGELTAGGVAFLGLVLTRWSLLMAAAGAGWGIAGVALGWGEWRTVPRTNWRTAGEAAVTTGIALATASLFSPRGDAFSMIAALVTAGFVLIALAAAIRSTMVATASFAAYGAAAVWIVWSGWFYRSVAGPGVEWLGLHPTRYTALTAYAAFAWFAAARLLHRRALPDLGPPAPTICAVLGTAWLGASIVHQDAHLASVSAAWSLLALGLAAARLIANGLHLERIAVIVLALAVATWIGACPPYPLPDWTAVSAWPLLSRPFLQGLWLAAAALGVAWVFRCVRVALQARVDAPGDDERSRWADQAEIAGGGAWLCIVAALAIVWVATTSEAARIAAPWSADATARHTAGSIWWGLFGVAMIVAGFARRIPAIRHTGLALLGIATGKALLIDLAAVGMEGRVASFIGLGLLMLGVAVLYARIAARLGEPVPHRGTAA